MLSSQSLLQLLHLNATPESRVLAHGIELGRQSVQYLTYPISHRNVRLNSPMPTKLSEPRRFKGWVLGI